MARDSEAAQKLQVRRGWMDAFGRDRVEPVTHLRAGPVGVASPNLMAAALEKRGESAGITGALAESVGAD